jgi:ribose transport system permease protein
MSSTARPLDASDSRLSAGGVVRFVRDNPLIPLIVLLLVLVAVLELIRPGIVNERWIGNTVKFAIPLAILAAAQTLTMLTGGIDLSVGFVATAVAFVMASLVAEMDAIIAIPLSLLPALGAGLATGIGVGVFRVHPLIMTLAVGLVVQGGLLMYQRAQLGSDLVIPEVVVWLGTGRSFGVPNSLLVFVPLAALIIFALRRFGYGRLLYALGDNEGAARLSGVRRWQVMMALYVISALLAGIGGLVYIGLINVAALNLADGLLLPSVAAAVIGGTSMFGGRGGYAGTIVGALILGVLGTILTATQVPEGGRRVIFGLIVILVTAGYVRISGERQQG